MRDIDLTDLVWAMDSLTIYRDLCHDPLIASLYRVLKEITAPEPRGAEIYRSYHDFCFLALEKGWPGYLLDLILESDNYFSRLANREGAGALTPEITKMVSRELKILRAIGRITASDLIQAAEGLSLPELSRVEWGQWDGGKPAGNEAGPESKGKHKGIVWLNAQRQAVNDKLGNDDGLALNPDDSVRRLAAYYHQAGYGICSRYIAFRWLKSSQKGGLAGIAQPDIVNPEQLIGLEREMKIIYENTEHLLAGKTAHNMLLYGNRGTGKSSAVKSLLSKYAGQGLRMVELAKSDLTDFQDIIQQLAEFSQKFILFIDDLSFEDMETEYKALKASLEGRLSVRADNTLIYATSNRRHLIRETFAERQGEDVHVQDNMNEKLSLADRFGLTVTFPATDQKRYLSIVEGLAVQAGIKTDKDELRQMALRWEMNHNGRSGRTARQFIDYLKSTYE